MQCLTFLPRKQTVNTSLLFKHLRPQSLKTNYFKITSHGHVSGCIYIWQVIIFSFGWIPLPPWYVSNKSVTTLLKCMWFIFLNKVCLEPGCYNFKISFYNPGRSFRPWFQFLHRHFCKLDPDWMWQQCMAKNTADTRINFTDHCTVLLCCLHVGRLREPLHCRFHLLT